MVSHSVRIIPVWALCAQGLVAPRIPRKSAARAQGFSSRQFGGEQSTNANFVLRKVQTPTFCREKCKTNSTRRGNDNSLLLNGLDSLCVHQPNPPVLVYRRVSQKWWCGFLKIKNSLPPHLPPCRLHLGFHTEPGLSPSSTVTHPDESLITQSGGVLNSYFLVTMWVFLLSLCWKPQRWPGTGVCFSRSSWKKTITKSQISNKFFDIFEYFQLEWCEVQDKGGLGDQQCFVLLLEGDTSTAKQKRLVTKQNYSRSHKNWCYVACDNFHKHVFTWQCTGYFSKNCAK